MEVTCSSCDKKINIPDGKIPKGQAFSFNCPSCKNKITIGPDAGPGDKQDKLSESDDFTPTTGKPVAMIAHTDPDKYRPIFEEMGYEVYTPSHHNAATNNLRENDYNMVLVTADFEAVTHSEASLLETLQRMNMADRRNIFVIYVAPDIKSFNNMEAFTMSVSVLVSSEDIVDNSIKGRLKKSIAENERRYRVYNEVSDSFGLL